MAPKGRVPSPDRGPLRSAVAEAYQHAAGLSDYFGRLTQDLHDGTEAVPDARALAEAEAMIAALAALVQKLPRLVPGFAERLDAAKRDRSDEAAEG
jgi:hypothetical protein